VLKVRPVRASHSRLLLCLALLLAAVGMSAAGQPVRVAFVDTGNTGRSVAAEALARNLIATGIEDLLAVAQRVLQQNSSQ